MNSKYALVTGVSRRLGLGFAVARQLAELNYLVILTARDVRQAEELAVELRRPSHTATALRLDLADRTSINGAAERLTKTFDHLDVLVNNASSFPDFRTRSALDVDLDALHEASEVDVFGCWGLIQALLPLLRRAPAARIVNVSSVAAQQTGKLNADALFSPAHSLAKYTLNALTTTLAAAFAETPILINAVDPGPVATHPERGDDDEDRFPGRSRQGRCLGSNSRPRRARRRTVFRRKTGERSCAMKRPLFVIFATIALDAIGIGLIFPILPRLLEEVTHARNIAPYVGSMIALYAVMQFLFAPMLGALSDRLGRRPVLLISLTGAAINYVVMAFAPQLWMLLLGRAIAGLTSANVSVAMAYITDISPEDTRARRFGLFNAMFGISFIIGPVLGGVLGDH
jgi:multidrug resistance protein